MRNGPRRRATLLAVAIAAAGCGSYRRIAPLDDAERAEIGRLREQVAGRRVFVGGAHRDVADALGTLGVELAPAPAAATPEIEAAGPAMGGCMNPMLGTALTLGILPYTQPPLARYQFRIVDSDGRETTRELELDDSATFGWLALPFGLLPGRTAFLGWPHADEAQESATRDRLALFLGRELLEPIR